MVQRIRVFTRQASVWANEGAADAAVASTDYQGVICVGPDSSDRVSWAIRDATNDDLDLKSIASDDTISASTEIDPATDTAELLAGPGVITSGNEIYVPYVDSTDDVTVANWTSGATPSAPTLTTGVSDSILVNSGAAVTPFPAICMAIRSNDDRHIVFVSD